MPGGWRRLRPPMGLGPGLQPQQWQQPCGQQGSLPQHAKTETTMIAMMARAAMTIPATGPAQLQVKPGVFTQEMYEQLSKSTPDVTDVP